MLSKMLFYVGIGACAVGCGILVLALTTYQQHERMRKHGRPVATTVVRTDERRLIIGNEPEGPSDYTFLAIVRFADPTTGAPLEREYGFPQQRADIVAGTRLDMLWDATKDELILAADAKDPWQACRPPLTVGGVVVAAGLLLLLAGRLIGRMLAR